MELCSSLCVGVFLEDREALSYPESCYLDVFKCQVVHSSRCRNLNWIILALNFRLRNMLVLPELVYPEHGRFQNLLSFAAQT